MAAERAEGQRLNDLAVGGDVDVPLVERMRSRQHAQVHGRHGGRSSARKQGGDRGERARLRHTPRRTEPTAVGLPELPAERIEEDEHDLLRARIGAAEAVRRQQRAALRAGQQELDGVWDVAERVVLVDRL